MSLRGILKFIIILNEEWIIILVLWFRVDKALRSLKMCSRSTSCSNWLSHCKLL